VGSTLSKIRLVKSGSWYIFKELAFVAPGDDGLVSFRSNSYCTPPIIGCRDYMMNFLSVSEITQVLRIGWFNVTSLKMQFVASATRVNSVGKSTTNTVF